MWHSRLRLLLKRPPPAEYQGERRFTMRLLLIGAGLALLALVLPSRQVAAADDTIKPGDKIGQMEVTTGRAGVRGLSVYCPDESDCTIPQVDKLAIGNAWDANSQQTLE